MTTDGRNLQKTALSPQEAAKALGFSLATIRRRLADGSLPCVQPGGRRTRVAIPLEALERFRPGPAEEPAAQPIDRLPPGQAADSPKLSGPRPRWMT